MEIKVCMGSACFIKGNQTHLAYIRRYIEENNLSATVKIIGGLCENKCEKGPRVIIDGKEYTRVTAEKIKQLLHEQKESL